MASPAQLEANRQNSWKSTGPTSSTGRAASRFNAVKSGIYAKELVLPDEDLAEFESVAANYQQQLRPLTQIEQFLVDSLIENDWRLRRLRKAETRLWAANPDPSVAFADNVGLTRLYRLIATTRRAYSQSLKEFLQALAVTEPACARPEPVAEPVSAEPVAATPDPTPAAELASFRQEPNPAPQPTVAAPPLPQPSPQTASATRSERPAEPKPAPKINLALRL